MLGPRPHVGLALGAAPVVQRQRQALRLDPHAVGALGRRPGRPRRRPPPARPHPADGRGGARPPPSPGRRARPAAPRGGRTAAGRPPVGPTAPRPGRRCGSARRAARRRRAVGGRRPGRPRWATSVPSKSVNTALRSAAARSGSTAASTAPAGHGVRARWWWSRPVPWSWWWHPGLASLPSVPITTRTVAPLRSATGAGEGMGCTAVASSPSVVATSWACASDPGA